MDLFAPFQTHEGPAIENGHPDFELARTSPEMDQLIDLRLIRVFRNVRRRQVITNEGVADLAGQIAADGLQNAIHIRPLNPRAPLESELVLVAGERRKRALEHLARLAMSRGETPTMVIRAKVRMEEKSDLDWLIEANGENDQREGMDPFDLGDLYAELLAKSDESGCHTPADVARRVNKKLSYVTTRLGLVKLIEGLQAEVGLGTLTVNDGGCIGQLPAEHQLHFADLAMRGKLNSTALAAAIGEKLREIEATATASVELGDGRVITGLPISLNGHTDGVPEVDHPNGALVLSGVPSALIPNRLSPLPIGSALPASRRLSAGFDRVVLGRQVTVYIVSNTPLTPGVAAKALDDVRNHLLDQPVLEMKPA